MKVVITVVGKDCVGILAKISNGCAEYNVNVLEVTQSVLSEMFCMIMIADISKISCDFSDFSNNMKVLGEKIGVAVRVMHEDIFNSMHSI